MIQVTRNLFQGPWVVFYSLETPLVSTLNISYYVLSLAKHKSHSWQKLLNLKQLKNYRGKTYMIYDYIFLCFNFWYNSHYC